MCSATWKIQGRPGIDNISERAREQERRGTSDPLELEMQIVVSHLMTVMGLEPWSSAKAKHTIDC